jgi:polyisoprenoid-binding protein YceI
MKRILVLSAALLMVGTAFASGEKGRMKVKSESSTLSWTGSKITGSSHNGTIAIQSGSISTEAGMITSANVVMDMNNIACTDDMEQEYKDKLVGHLQSEDFFNSAEHKSAVFTLTSFKQVKGESYTVTGNLTIKGISNEITFPATVKMDDAMVSVDADLSIDRTKWDVHYGSGSIFDGLGDNVINDDVDISIHIEAAQ